MKNKQYLDQYLAGLYLKPLKPIHTKCPDDWCLINLIIPDYDFIYINKGKGSITINGTAYKLFPGRLIIISPGDFVNAEHYPPENIEAYAIHFSMTESNTGSPAELKIKKVYDFEDTGFKSRYQALIKREADKKYFFSGRIGFIHWVLDKLLTVNCIRLNKPAGSQKENYRECHRIINYAKEQLNFKMSVKEMAGFSGLDTTTIHRYFSEVTGFSPAKYMRKLRLSKSTELIIKNIEIEKTALQCGFPDRFSFSRAFKREYGISPVNWRKKRIL